MAWTAPQVPPKQQVELPAAWTALESSFASRTLNSSGCTWASGQRRGELPCFGQSEGGQAARDFVLQIGQPEGVGAASTCKNRFSKFSSSRRWASVSALRPSWNVADLILCQGRSQLAGRACGRRGRIFSSWPVCSQFTRDTRRRAVAHASPFANAVGHQSHQGCGQFPASSARVREQRDGKPQDTSVCERAPGDSELLHPGEGIDAADISCIGRDHYVSPPNSPRH